MLSPNNNTEADAMASIVVHELTEAATDPYLSAWFQKSGNQYAPVYRFPHRLTERKYARY